MLLQLNKRKKNKNKNEKKKAAELKTRREISTEIT